MACFLDFTLGPVFEPECNFPSFHSCIVFSILSDLPFLAILVPSLHPLSEIVPRAGGVLQLLHDSLGDVVQGVGPTIGEGQVQLLRLLVVGAAQDGRADEVEWCLHHSPFPCAMYSRASRLCPYHVKESRNEG